MNKTGIEWCDYTWNPVTGCEHPCDFCYARKVATRFNVTKAFPKGFAPTMHPERLVDPYKMKKPQTIFVVSMGDLFGNWVPDYWIDQVVYAATEAPQHTYIFLTKNPEHMRRYFDGKKVQPNFWLGTSVGENLQSWDRMQSIMYLGSKGWNTLLSVEPLKAYADVTHKIWNLENTTEQLSHIGWVIIGMQTNPLEPCEPEVLEEVVKRAIFYDIPVFLKDSTLLCFGRAIVPPYREFPIQIHLNKEGAHGKNQQS